MVRRTKEEAQQTRADIVSAAVNVLFEKGLSGAKLEDIAEAAGVTRGAVYWHFKNKADLMIEIHHQLHETFESTLIGDDRTALPTLEKFRRGWTDMLHRLEHDEPHKRKLSLMLSALHADGMEELHNLKTSHQAEKMIHIEAIFQNAMNTDEMQAGDSKFLAMSFYCMVCGIMQGYLQNPAMFRPSTDGVRMIEDFFRSHGARN